MRQETKALLVMGMHRSGTSALAKGLEVFGADLGTNLMAATDANPKGYYEDLDIWRLNNVLLESSGCAWQSIAKPDEHRLEALLKSDLFESAVNLILSRKEETNLFGLKDPRFSYLLPFWNAVFKAAEVKTLCLIAIRNPAHTAASLVRAERIPMEQGHYLWLSYILAALENTCDSPTVLTDYASFLADPSAELRRIGRAFNLTADDQRLHTYTEEFLCSNLNRSSAAAQDAPPIVQHVYEHLAEECKAGDSLNTATLPLTQWRDETKHALSFLHRLNKAEATISEQASRLEEQAALISIQSSRIEALTHSTSWRLTTPLRAVGDLLRGNSKEFFGKNGSYADWVQTHEAITREATADTSRATAHAEHPVTISVVLDGLEASPKYIDQTIQSVLGQIYPHWRLLVLSNPGANSRTAKVLAKHAAGDSRIIIVPTPADNGSPRRSAPACAAESGDFVTFVRAGDKLAPQALTIVVEAIAGHPEANLIYSDEDEIASKGERRNPVFKPCFNWELLLCHNVIGNMAVYRRAALEDIGALRYALSGPDHWDLALRMAERGHRDQIVHVPQVLYHARAGRVVANSAVQAVAEHLARTGVAATVEPAPEVPGANRIRYKLPSQPPLVTIIIPTKNHAATLQRCVESVRAKTTYRRYELLVVDNGSNEQKTLSYLRELGSDDARVISELGDFNFSRLNNIASKAANGDVLCMLNDDAEVMSPGWLEEMVSIALQPGVGAVGARLWYPTGRLQHAGVVLGLGGVAGHAHRHLKRGDWGYMDRAALQQEFSAVTAACLVVTKTAFEKVGGFDEALAVACNDIDFCLKLKRAGYRNIWTPYAELLHHESLSRGTDDTPEKQRRAASENRIMKQRWAGILLDDPAYNPNLTLDDESFGLAWPPRRVARG
jgi:GT2 family glycosyltransferase